MKKLNIEIIKKSEDKVTFKFIKSTYEINKEGEVFSLQRDRLLSQLNNGNGYLGVTLSSGGVDKRFYTHRLVATCFIGDPEEERNQVNHKDHDKSNNHVSNLEWTTPKENSTKAQKFHRGRTIEQSNARQRNKWLGKKIGCKTVIGLTEEMNHNGNYYAVFECDCGNVTKQIYNHVAKKAPKNCRKCRPRESYLPKEKR